MKKNIRFWGIGILAIVFLIVLAVVFVLNRDKTVSITPNPGESLFVESFPDRSFHEEVDASTGATLLWNEQKYFQNIKVSEEEKLAIIYPFQNAVFPADFSPASFIWKSEEPQELKWHISFSVSGFEYRATTTETRFMPDVDLWEKLKKESKNKAVTFSVSSKKLERKVVFSFSKDSVDAPIFYRATPLPFSYANKYRDRLKWYLGDVSKNKKRVMLENMPVCANCHSFSTDGKTFAMDVDYGNDKGNYAVSNVERESKIGLENIVSWTDFKREDGVSTFGLLAKISPDGKYAISTVKDKSIFVPVDKSFWYSQLFFPVKGMLVYYDIENQKFTEMKGASSSEFVQSSPEWAPGMSEILFSRSSYNQDTSLEAQTNVVLDMRFADDYINRRKDFKFDLCRVPWNEGKGGEPVPIKDASQNNKSNYFARYSPDGKWIVFCQAKNFMLLQPDSKLYMMPAEGGKPRLMNCNTNEMNSWHSFSPNSKWMVFSTKYFGPYTQLFLTHIDENGNDTPPIWLEQLTVDMKASNIPEFVNVNYDDWLSIKDEFTKTEYYASTVAEHDYKTKDINAIIEEAEIQINSNPDDYRGYYLKAVMLSEQGNVEQAKINAQHCIEMIEKMQDKGFKEYGDLGLAYFIAENTGKAIEMSRKSVEINPNHLFAWMTLGDIYYKQRDYENTNKVYSKIIELDSSVEYRLKRAQLKMAAKSLYREAINDLEVILKTEDCHAMALQLLVQCYSALNDTKKVEEISTKLVGCNPYTGYFSRAKNYLQEGKYQQAVNDFTEGLKYNKDDLRALFLRAQAFYKLAKYQEALSDIQKVKQMLTSNPSGQFPVPPDQLDEMITQCKKLIEAQKHN
ncbi:tetratricopeptide repeat protein [Mariniphaga sediminis]|uniref:tetratricopeptide repeat protein n=1 Tax=Mariniphaga sediminis TaxID=1628158 RepID=UPI0035672FB6